MLFSGWTGNLDAHSGQAKKIFHQKNISSHHISGTTEGQKIWWGGDNITGKYFSQILDSYGF